MVKEHQERPLFSRPVVSSYKGPILLLFSCGSWESFERMLYFDFLKNLNTAIKIFFIDLHSTNYYKFICTNNAFYCPPETFFTPKYSTLWCFVHVCFLGLKLFPSKEEYSEISEEYYININNIIINHHSKPKWTPPSRHTPTLNQTIHKDRYNPI